MRRHLIWTLVLLIASAFHVSAEPAKKVFVLGVDGLDPKLLQAYIDRDMLPNFKGLIERGEFKPLQTSMPPLSPVAWSTFISGMDPGGHGVFDFIHRDPATLMPTRAESGTNEAKTLPLGGCTVMPQPFSGGPENLRHGRAFWQILEDRGIPTTVFRIPANFPPVDSAGKSFSGMGTPDILGTPGTFSFYTDRHVPDSGSISGGKVYPVQVVEDRVEARLVGPADPFRDHSRRECRRKLEVDFKVYLDPDRPVAKLQVQDEEFVLEQGEWSEWIPVEFKALPMFASVSSIGRFYLKQVRPDFELYVTPLQIDPANPGAMQLSTPESWSHELCEELGYFYTQELPEDTKAFKHGILDGSEFWDQAQFVFAERRRAFEHILGQWEEGLLFFYFSSVDQTSHMLYRYMDPEHPDYREDELLTPGIPNIYREMDEVVGRALQVVDEDTTFVIMSDHGFSPFRWQVNLNSWLLERGYVTLKDPTRQGRSILFGNVDWSRTQAYALGLNGLYVNLRGREKNGIVNPGRDHEELLARLEKDLLGMVDPRNGQQAVSLVVNTRRDFHGPFVEEGPDIIVGYDWGYRSSWASPLGEFPREIFLDNHDAWSGDHSMDYRHVPGVLITNKKITLDQPALHDLTVGVLDEYGVEKTEEMIGSDCLGDR